VDALIACAVRTGTALEIDAIPDRMDLRDEHARRAVAAGAKLVIDSDAHHPDQLRLADELGVAVARRGWVRKADVLNTLPLPRLLRALKGGATVA
jgi:DNA polymerase (family 10)